MVASVFGPLSATSTHSSTDIVDHHSSASIPSILLGNTRRRLMFTNNIYQGEAFYLDLRTANGCRQRSSIEADLVALGGRIEAFLSKDVTHVITDRNDSTSQPSPGLLSTPIINGHKHGSSQGTRASPAAFSRAQALLNRSVSKQQQVSQQQQVTSSVSATASDPVSLARLWGIRVSPMQKILGVIEAEKAKCDPNRKLILSSGSKRPVRSKKLEGAFVKVEDEESQFRPTSKTFSSFPVIDMCNPAIYHNQSPFAPRRKTAVANQPVKNKPPGVSIGQNGKNDEKRLASPVSGATATGDQAHKPVVSKSKPTQKVTSKQPNQSGFCEPCDVHYTSLKEHVQSISHRRFAAKTTNFLSLDDVISHLPTLDHLLSGLSDLSISAGPGAEEPACVTPELLECGLPGSMDESLKSAGMLPPTLLEDEKQPPSSKGICSADQENKLPEKIGVRSTSCESLAVAKEVQDGANQAESNAKINSSTCHVTNAPVVEVKIEETTQPLDSQQVNITCLSNLDNSSKNLKASDDNTPAGYALHASGDSKPICSRNDIAETPEVACGALHGTENSTGRKPSIICSSQEIKEARSRQTAVPNTPLKSLLTPVKSLSEVKLLSETSVEAVLKELNFLNTNYNASSAGNGLGLVDAAKSNSLALEQTAADLNHKSVVNPYPLPDESVDCATDGLVSDTNSCEMEVSGRETAAPVGLSLEHNMNTDATSTSFGIPDLLDMQSNDATMQEPLSSHGEHFNVSPLKLVTEFAFGCLSNSRTSQPPFPEKPAVASPASTEGVMDDTMRASNSAQSDAVPPDSAGGSGTCYLTSFTNILSTLVAKGNGQSQQQSDTIPDCSSDHSTGNKTLTEAELISQETPTMDFGEPPQGMSILESQMSTLGSHRTSTLVSQEMSPLASQGTSTLASQGISAFTAQGMSTFESQGMSTLASQGSSTLISQEMSTLACHGTSTLVSQGMCTLASQGAHRTSTLISQDMSTLTSHGTSTLVSQEMSTFASQGMCTLASQGTSARTENIVIHCEQSESQQEAASSEAVENSIAMNLMARLCEQGFSDSSSSDCSRNEQSLTDIVMHCESNTGREAIAQAAGDKANMDTLLISEDIVCHGANSFTEPPSVTVGSHSQSSSMSTVPNLQSCTSDSQVTEPSIPPESNPLFFSATACGVDLQSSEVQAQAANSCALTSKESAATSYPSDLMDINQNEWSLKTCGVFCDNDQPGIGLFHAAVSRTQNVVDRSTELIGTSSQADFGIMGCGSPWSPSMILNPVSLWWQNNTKPVVEEASVSSVDLVKSKVMNRGPYDSQLSTENQSNAIKPKKEKRKSKKRKKSDQGRDITEFEKVLCAQPTNLHRQGGQTVKHKKKKRKSDKHTSETELMETCLDAPLNPRKHKTKKHKSHSKSKDKDRVCKTDDMRLKTPQMKNKQFPAAQTPSAGPLMLDDANTGASLWKVTPSRGLKLKLCRITRDPPGENEGTLRANSPLTVMATAADDSCQNRESNREHRKHKKSHRRRKLEL